MEYIALIPAYEPEENMIPLLKELADKKFEIILVNDGSASEYDPLFEEACRYARVLCYAENRGKGYALRTGFRYIKEHFPEDSIVVTLDCDGQHKAEDALKAADTVKEHPGCVCFGSREIPPSSPLRSRVGNAVTRVWFTLITFKKVHDTQTGLRAFPAKYLDILLKQDGDRYEYEIGTLLSLSLAGVEILELPIETIYINNNANSHFKPVSDTLKLWKRMLRFSKDLLIRTGIIITVIIGIIILIRRTQNGK